MYTLSFRTRDPGTQTHSLPCTQESAEGILRWPDKYYCLLSSEFWANKTNKWWEMEYCHPYQYTKDVTLIGNCSHHQRWSLRKLRKETKNKYHLAAVKIARRNINNPRPDDTTFMAESKEAWQSLLTKVKREEWKADLKLNIQKTKIMISSLITSWQIDWGNQGNSDRLYFLGLQNHCRWWLQPWN